MTAPHQEGPRDDNPNLPNERLAALIAPVLASVAEADRPVAIAMAERIAAERYREWAKRVDDAEAQGLLLACAAREDEIAGKVEALASNVAEIHAQINSSHPDLAEGYRALFEGLSLSQQFAFQAGAERAGAALWRTIAAEAAQVDRPTYLECASLEEASATVLETLNAQGVKEQADRD